MQTLSVSKLTSKSQATIPGRVRQKLGLKPGDSVAFKFSAGQVYLQKARPMDHALAGAVGETLQDEWHSANDERAYRDL
jgi:AbrB family looped-hinge helix DNA binding protein